MDNHQPIVEITGLGGFGTIPTEEHIQKRNEFQASLKELMSKGEAYFGAPCSVLVASDEMPYTGCETAGRASVSNGAGERAAFFFGEIAAKIYSGRYLPAGEKPATRRYAQSLAEMVAESGGSKK